MRQRSTIVLGGALLAAALVTHAGVRGQGGPGDPPYTPEQSMSMLRVEPGFRIELVASEPDVQSPVAMDVDEDGRIWVVEMPGYPLDVSPSGRVKLLEDTDGDGRVDKSTLFADNLVLPSGVMRYKRGILVTSPPDLIYLEDVDGDGKADTREVILTGFARTNPQHAVNHPVFGLDNWIYLAHSGGSEPVIYRDLFGDKGTDLRFAAMPTGKALDAKGRGVRLKPESHVMEALSSRTQYGNAFDAYGHYFAHNNSIHQRHEAIAARYLERNPHLLLPSAMADISDHGNNNIMPITHGARFDLLTEAGQFTSACALTVYGGGAFPEGYEGTTFIAEPVHNLIHRDVLTPKGSTFVASRARTDMEFLASQDAWFRPVNLYVGPDAGLYVIDYYRPYIEHPEWASSDLQRNPGILSTGKDRGRIYRIVSADAPTDRRAQLKPALGSATNAQLVAALASPNQWQRRTAQRLLVHDGRRGAVPALVAMANHPPSAIARLHALWTLDGLDRLEAAPVLAALTDADPGIRENAIVLAERWLSKPDVAQALLARVDDPDPRVRFQLLATLGSLSTPASLAAQEQLLLRDIEDEWVQVAALSASSDRAAAYFARAVAPGSPFTASESPGRARFFDRLGGVLAARQKAGEITTAISAVNDAAATGEWWRASLLEGIARGVTSADRRALAGSQATLLTIATGDRPRLRRAAVTLLAAAGVEAGSATTTALATATRITKDAKATADARVDAIALIALVNPTASRSLFESVIGPGEPDAVQVAGVSALGRIPGAETPAFLLAHWPAMSTTVRTRAATVILARREGSNAMLDALQQGTVKRWMLNFGHTRSLIMHRDESIRARARTVLEEAPEARAARLARYAAALGGRGEASRGEAVFVTHCAMCHQVDGRNGVEIGPDLSTVRHQPMPVLLANILEPNRSIAQHYETYAVERSSGDPLVGVIGEQSPTSITFRQGPGVTTTVRRADIRTMSVVPQSIMPESFAEQISPEEMADLLVFLTSSPRQASAPATPASAGAGLPDAATATPAAIASALLDDTRDRQARDVLARDAAPRASAVVQALVAGLPDNDETEEYRRIPWIWRVAVAAGRAANEPALIALMDASMPDAGERLRDWQAVVLGGGVVMGLSQAGVWPGDVMAPWLAQDAARAARWQRSLDLAIAMVDETRVRNGTRYDAQRMLAVLPWERAGGQLTRYLSKDVDAELQMGAIAGLADMRDARAADALAAHIAEYTERNRAIAIDGLLKTDAGRTRLKASLTSGAVPSAWLTPEQRVKLER